MNISLFAEKIKKKILNYANPRFWEKKPRFEDIKNEKLSMKMNFFSKKTMIFIISDLFLSIK